MKPDIDAIRAASDKEAVARLMGRSNQGFMGSVFDAAIYDDAKDPLKYAVILGQSGLGLPDRDYYLTRQFAEKKAKYQAYVAQTLAAIAWPDAQSMAAVTSAGFPRVSNAISSEGCSAAILATCRFVACEQLPESTARRPPASGRAAAASPSGAA